MILNGWANILRTFSLYHVNTTAHKHAILHAHILQWAPHFHGQKDCDGVFCCCLYADIQTPLPPSPASIIECLLKEKTNPADVCELFDLETE